MTKGAISACIAIAVALIGAAATVYSAYIQRPANASESRESLLSSVPQTVQIAKPVIREAELEITGVQIGSATDELFVSEQRTVFEQNEEIAATIHFRATQRIRNFPVRLTVTFGNPLFGQLKEEQTIDISSPGDGRWTFRFPARERTSGDYLFLVLVDASRVYTKMIDIR